MDKQQERDNIKRYLQDYVEHITRKSRGNNYICPICHSGEGKNGTGAFSIKDGTSWKCFSCGNGGDIFDLYGLVNNTQDHKEQYSALAGMYGNRTYTPQAHHKPEDSKEETDYTDFFLQAHKYIDNTDYWSKRGLSRETVDRFNIGYIAEWRHPKAPNAPASPRLIIPTSKYSYLARDTRADIPEEQKQYNKSKVGTIHIFNQEALYNASRPIYIVEGEIDAMSIIEAGGEAVGLGSKEQRRKFAEKVKKQRPTQPLIIALDNEEKTKKDGEELYRDLKQAGIACHLYNPYGKYKDANDALVGDVMEFAKAINEGEKLLTEEEETQKNEYLKTSTAHYLQNFIDGITDSVNTVYTSTGFKKFDEALDGGLYEGLYIVGAISSLGKTTLITQIADQMAQAGTDVLIFSLEMARAEIMAKSISRHTLQNALASDGNTRNAKTSRGITTGSRYASYSTDEKNNIYKAINDYSTYAQKIYISEGIGDIGVKQIRETVSKHVLFTGRTPIVIIDYLQILAPYSEKMTDKQNTDKAVLELKRISRDYKTPVICISSFNRANYKEAVTMEAFKESGAIEYSSDVLIGLQLKGAGAGNFDATEAKKKEPREIELVILKNRNGRIGDKIPFAFYPLFNYFAEL